ncbi:hypothetical protein GCM10017783_03680 [Deinococcus piscis]|uniref:Uncharacterized protein n=1 Tax=Deinococcus piscis TaxID=394230 RepID=A0ABQ3K1M6_9DEIO|nr:hypothetical protein [Deinococcus piscis]GHF95054.1 hypothetical protein GCM10017783_03680 [Deinococcus piscis]
MLALLFVGLLLLPLLLMAALLGLAWGALAQRFWPRKRWPAVLVLLLALILPAGVALDWSAQVKSAIALDAPHNSASAVAAAQVVAGQFAWAVKLAVAAGLGLTAALLLGRGRWGGHGWGRWLAPLGPLVMAGLLWRTLPLRNGIQLSDFQPDMAQSVVITGVLCLYGSVSLGAFVYLTAPRPWWLEDELPSPPVADTSGQ